MDNNSSLIKHHKKQREECQEQFVTSQNKPTEPKTSQIDITNIDVNEEIRKKRKRELATKRMRRHRQKKRQESKEHNLTSQIYEQSTQEMIQNDRTSKIDTDIKVNEEIKKKRKRELANERMRRHRQKIRQENKEHNLKSQIYVQSAQEMIQNDRISQIDTDINVNEEIKKRRKRELTNERVKRYRQKIRQENTQIYVQRAQEMIRNDQTSRTEIDINVNEEIEKKRKRELANERMRRYRQKILQENTQIYVQRAQEMIRNDRISQIDTDINVNEEIKKKRKRELTNERVRKYRQKMRQKHNLTSQIYVQSTQEILNRGRQLKRERNKRYREKKRMQSYNINTEAYDDTMPILEPEIFLEYNVPLIEPKVEINEDSTPPPLKRTLIRTTSGYRCGVCQSPFVLRDLAIAHLRSAHPVMPYQCPYCKQRFTTQYSFTHHIKEDHPDEPEK